LAKQGINIVWQDDQNALVNQGIQAQELIVTTSLNSTLAGARAKLTEEIAQPSKTEPTAPQEPSSPQQPATGPSVTPEQQTSSEQATNLAQLENPDPLVKNDDQIPDSLNDASLEAKEKTKEIAEIKNSVDATSEKPELETGGNPGANSASNQ